MERNEVNLITVSAGLTCILGVAHMWEYS